MDNWLRQTVLVDKIDIFLFIYISDSVNSLIVMLSKRAVRVYEVLFLFCLQISPVHSFYLFN